MAMRLSGLMSGMDTESIIKDLVSAKKTKVDKEKKAQTKMEWKQNAWKDLNTKLKNLQTKYISNMRFSTSYAKKTTKVSNSSAVSVITGENAVNGVQSLTVDKLAKTAYLTGGKLDAASDGEKWTALSKISDIAGSGFAEGNVSISVDGKTADINITGETTVSDFLNKVKEIGLNASFDANQQRFFISARESGSAHNFSITASDQNGMAALSALGLQMGLTTGSASLKQYEEYAGYYVEGDRDATLSNMRGMIDQDLASKTENYLEKYKSAQKSIKTAQDKIAELEEKYKDDPLESYDSYKASLDEKNEQLKELQKQINCTPLAEQAELRKQKSELEKEIEDITQKANDAKELSSAKDSITSAEKTIADLEEKITVVEETAEDGTITYSAEAKEQFAAAVEQSYYQKAEYAASVMADYQNGALASANAIMIEGQDAEISLNGAKFTSSTNGFEINGLTFTALSETKPGEEVTITTQDDTDGIYDMIKNFFKEYNAVINEMDKLYNAESAKDYEPLTDEEKDALSDTEIEKYETKIKDALLRRDDNLYTISSAMKSALSSGVDMGDGRQMYLSDFGVDVLSYFVAGDNEKNMYHIDGDPDDASTSGKADKLKSMIASDPNTVIDFFSKLSQNLYSKMSEVSKSVDGYRSFGSFYDDKKMKSDYADYTSKIASLEEKLADYEDKWYKKFSKMETAMAKMQSNTNAITSLLGGQ